MTTPQSFIRASAIYLSLTTLIFAASVGYGAFKFNVAQNYKQAIAASEDIRKNIEVNLDKVKKELSDLMESHRAKDEEFHGKILSILPPDENYTELTRVFDEFFLANDTPGNPIFQSSLNYGKNAPLKDSPGISALPITMNIEASRDNLFKLLDFVYNSGSFDTGIRLMAIQSIHINFPDEGEIIQSAGQELNVTITMQAYNETPKVARQ